MGGFNFAYNRDTTIEVEVLKKLVLAIAVLSCTAPAFAQSHKTLDNLFYFVGTPPMTRLQRAAVEVRVDNNRAVLYLGTAGKNNELTESAAAKALGEPQRLDGALNCTKEDLKELGLSSDERDGLHTLKFKLHTKENSHYWLLFLGKENKLQFWRLILEKDSDQPETVETKWAPTSTTVSFTGVQPHLNYLPDADAAARELQRQKLMHEKFRRGEVDRSIGVDSWPRFDKRKSPYPDKQIDK